LTTTSPRKRSKEEELATSASCTPRKQPSSPAPSPRKRSKEEELATSASCTPRKQPSLTTTSPRKRSKKEELATSASCTPRKQPSLTTTSHGNRSNLQELETPSVKKAKIPGENLVEMKQAAVDDDTKNQKRPFHCKVTHEMVNRITQDTRNDAKSLEKFGDANTLLEQAGWSRCRTTEHGFSYANLTHPSYLVKQMPRDGKCMYHCMLQILKEEGVMNAPSDAEALRKALAKFVDEQDPPKGCDKGKYPFGGIYGNDGEYLPLEHSIKNTYGGEIALAIFVQLYGITVHCIAPESMSHQVTHEGYGKDGKQYRMLQTLSWTTWTLCRTFDENGQVTNISYERSYLGDHWQLLQTASEEQPRGEVAQKNGNPASASSAAATAPKHPRQTVAKVAPQQLDFCDSVQSTAPKQISTEFQGPLSAQFMLRQVSSSKLFLRGAIPDIGTELHNMLRVFTWNNLNFLEDDFGEEFCRVYARSVQELLYALPDLNVPHRSFFIALGMGADVDPYTLQYTFQSHAMKISKLHLPPAVSQGDVKALMEPGAPVHFKILKWCWPAAFNAFRIFVLHSDSKKMFIFQAKTRRNKVDIILRCNRNHYTLLHAIEGATANDLMKTVVCENERILHETHAELRCPDVSTFDSFCNETSYLSAALQGSEPSEKDLDFMWNEATEKAGLEYDIILQKWLRFPNGIKNTQLASNTDGSLQVQSWKLLQKRLLAALESDRENGQQHERRYSTKSPPHAEIGDDVCLAGVTFMDAGSESGKGMYRMMSDKRITHVAGVELQKPWFDASCKIMAHLRQSFAKRNFRMPAVTILHSCMLDLENKFPELTYLYSSAGLLWMNNYAMDNPREPFFATKASNTKKPMPLVPGCNNLSTNAAHKFSQDFTGVTWLAVHNSEWFWSSSHYTAYKPMKVQVTWSSKPCEVTILRHVQHIEITEHRQQKKGQKFRVHTKGLNLPSPTQHDLKLWDDFMMQFSDLVPRLYEVISGEKFLKDRCRVASAEATGLIDAMHSPVPANSLVLLRDSFWLSTDIMLGYQSLLKQTFPCIWFKQLYKTISVTKRPEKFPRIIVGYWNLQEKHWIAIKLDMIQKYVAIADSLYSTFQGMHDVVFQDVENIATKLGHSGELTRYTVDVPDQCNCNDCGVFACLFQLYMAQTVSA
jgi:hypothetical protein